MEYKVYYVLFKLVVYVLFIFILNIFYIYTVKFIVVVMVFGYFIIYEILIEGSWLKCRGYRMFLIYGKKEIKYIKIFLKFLNGFFFIWWGLSFLFWLLF